LNLNKPITTVQCSDEITITIIDMGRKFRGRTGSPSNTKSPGPRPSSIPSDILSHAAIWPQQIWAENWEGLCPFGERGARSSSKTMWPGPRPICMPTFILIRPAVWPQYTNVTRSQTDRQDNGPIAYGDWRTVLQTVCPKTDRRGGLPATIGDAMKNVEYMQ